MSLSDFLSLEAINLLQFISFVFSLQLFPILKEQGTSSKVYSNKTPVYAFPNPYIVLEVGSDLNHNSHFRGNKGINNMNNISKEESQGKAKEGKAKELLLTC